MAALPAPHRLTRHVANNLAGKERPVAGPHGGLWRAPHLASSRRARRRQAVAASWLLAAIAAKEGLARECHVAGRTQPLDNGARRWVGGLPPLPQGIGPSSPETGNISHPRYTAERVDRSSDPRERIEPISMRIPDACRFIWISRSTLYLLIARGEVEVIKLGNSTLVLTESRGRMVVGRRRRERVAAERYTVE